MKLPNFGGIIKKIFHRSHGISAGRNPYRDWQKIVIVWTILLLVSLAGAVFLFFGIDKGTLFRPGILSESTTPTLDRASFSKLSDYYKQRELQTANLKATSTIVVDPSL